MDLESILTEVETWPVGDRLRLMEVIWDRLADQGYEPELTDDLKAMLDRRLAALDENPENVMTWEVIKEYVRCPR